MKISTHSCYFSAGEKTWKFQVSKSCGAFWWVSLDFSANRSWPSSLSACWGEDKLVLVLNSIHFSPLNQPTYSGKKIYNFALQFSLWWEEITHFMTPCWFWVIRLRTFCKKSAQNCVNCNLESVDWLESKPEIPLFFPKSSPSFRNPFWWFINLWCILFSLRFVVDLWQVCRLTPIILGDSSYSVFPLKRFLGAGLYSIFFSICKESRQIDSLRFYFVYLILGLKL